MTTELEYAESGIITPKMKKVANAEHIDVKKLSHHIKKGRVVILTRKDCNCLGIGVSLRTKINANIGTSPTASTLTKEIKKAKIAEKYGADTISDLSMSGDIDLIRKNIFSVTSVPITTVPIYQSVVEKGSFYNLTEKDLLAMIKKHVNEGVSSVVIHAGFTYEMLELLKRVKRIMGIVSKGGSFTAAWMIEHKEENPFLVNFDTILDTLYENDVVLSLGNTMRSGCIHDVKDSPQLMEINLNTKLAEQANKKGIQVIVEGMGGHVNITDIEPYVKLYKKITGGRPLFVAGPLPIDIAVGYDHIAGCVGASIASGAGADYLCYITPAEHLRLPSVTDVKLGMIAYKIAAHIGDTAKYGKSNKDLELAKYRSKRDWKGQLKYALFPQKAKRTYEPSMGSCTMCGNFCAIAIMEHYLKN